MNLAADDGEAQPRMAALVQALQQLGWTAGRDVQIDYRWGAGDTDHYRKYAAGLVALKPEHCRWLPTPRLSAPCNG